MPSINVLLGRPGNREIQEKEEYEKENEVRKIPINVLLGKPRVNHENLEVIKADCGDYLLQQIKQFGEDPGLESCHNSDYILRHRRQFGEEPGRERILVKRRYPRQQHEIYTNVFSDD